MTNIEVALIVFIFTTIIEVSLLDRNCFIVEKKKLKNVMLFLLRMAQYGIKSKGHTMTKYNYDYKLNNYLSPPELVELALKIKGVKCFALDTCCSKKNIPALKYFIEGKKDGLNEPWAELNWCNPPFDKAAFWIRKAYKEQQKGNETVMLIPVRTETKYWHDYILFNNDVHIEWLRKKYGFLHPRTKQSMGIFKNALALVFFNVKEQQC